LHECKTIRHFLRISLTVSLIVILMAANTNILSIKNESGVLAASPIKNSNEVIKFGNRIEGKIIDVLIEYPPSSLKPGVQTNFEIKFLQKGTDRLQEKIDYDFTISREGQNIYSASETMGQKDSLLFSSKGVARIPYTFTEVGNYIITVSVFGVNNIGYKDPDTFKIYSNVSSLLSTPPSSNVAEISTNKSSVGNNSLPSHNATHFFNSADEKMLTQISDRNQTTFLSYMTSLQKDVQNLTSEFPDEFNRTKYSIFYGDHGDYNVNLTFPDIGTVEAEQRIIRDVIYSPTAEDLTQLSVTGKPIYDLKVDITNTSNKITVTMKFFVPYSSLPPQLVKFFDQPGNEERGVRIEKKFSTNSGTLSTLVNLTPVMGPSKQFADRFSELSRLWDCINDESVDWGLFGQRFPGQYEQLQDQIERLNRVSGLFSAWNLFTEFVAGGVAGAKGKIEKGSFGSLWSKPTVKPVELVFESAAGVGASHLAEHYAERHWVEKEISKIAAILDPWCKGTKQWTGSFKDYYRLNSKYSPGGIVVGQFAFDILPDATVAGNGSGEIREAAPYANLLWPKEKGECIKHAGGDIEFYVSGNADMRAPIPKAHLIFSLVESSYTLHCIEKNGVQDIQEGIEKVRILYFLHKLSCAGVCRTEFDIELKDSIISKREVASANQLSKSGDPYSRGSFSKIELYKPLPPCEPGSLETSRCLPDLSEGEGRFGEFTK